MRELQYLDKDELLRGAELIGLKRKKLENRPIEFIRETISIKVVPDGKEEINIARACCELYNLEYPEDENLDALKTKLYKDTVRRQQEVLKKMKPNKRKELAENIEKTLDPKIAEKYAQRFKKLGITGKTLAAFIATGHLVSIAAFGSGLGLCIASTTSLSAISGLIGVTFPFAAYTGAAVIAGWVLAIGNVIGPPALAITIVGVGYTLYRKYKRRPLLEYIGLNYYCQAMKALKGIDEEKHRIRSFIEKIFWWRKPVTSNT